MKEEKCEKILLECFITEKLEAIYLTQYGCTPMSETSKKKKKNWRTTVGIDTTKKNNNNKKKTIENKQTINI